MFRKMRRSAQALSEKECIEVLREEKRGVLSVNGDGGYPYGMPLNHWYCPEDGHLYFHGGKAGHRVDAAERDDRVSYCVYDRGFVRPGEWAMNVRSVIVFGRLRRVEDTERAMEICRQLCLKFPCGEEYIQREIRESGPRTLVYELVPEHMTGKLVNEA